MTKALSLLIVGAVALAVAPADAKTTKHKRARAAYASGQVAPPHYGLDRFPAGPLYYNGGTYMGDDPDPFIRLQIWRDVSGRFGGGDN